MCVYFFFCMDYLFSIVTEKNCESLCALELSDRFNLEGSLRDGFVDFSADFKTAVRVAYFSQSARRLILKVGSGSFNELDDLLSSISSDLKNGSWSDFFSNKYRVSCARQGVHDFNSVIVEQEVSALIKNELSARDIEGVADYNTRDLIFFVHIVDGTYLFGLDFAGKDLSKRHYLFFNNPIAVKGTLAFNLILFSGFKPGFSLLDCFALAGVIPIEAALYDSNRSINSFSKEFFFPIKVREEAVGFLKEFDLEVTSSKTSNIFSCDSSFPNLAAQKKNSRIAGVEKNIAFSRTDAFDLDIKNFGKDIDVVCSRVLEPSKKISESVAVRSYEDFFSACDSFLKKSGVVCFVVRNPLLVEKVALKHGFKVVDKLETSQGLQDFFFVKFSRA